MDLEDARRVLFTKVQSFDSENALKIIGYLLIQDWKEQDLLRLALDSDVCLHSLVSKAKREMGLVTKSSAVQLGQSPLQQGRSEVTIALQSTESLNSSLVQVVPNQYQPPLNESLSSSFGFNRSNSLGPSVLSQSTNQWSPPQLPSYQSRPSFSMEGHDDRQVNSHDAVNNLGQLPSTNGFKEPHNFMQATGKWVSSSLFDATHVPANAVMSWKPCLFFSRGYCKNGNNCRFLHYADNSDAFNPNALADDSSESIGSDDEVLSLDCLKQDLRELLHGKQVPVSIAALPQLYYERFGKPLHVEGYLTESKRHGKVGYSLTKLLMKLKGTVTLIERPHGQHAVMLTEDAHKIMEAQGNQDGPYTGSPSFRQIYLTFPPESIFTEEDVTLHFRSYGPVQDVRIPYQQKRMFGFVSFVYPETATLILAEGNPHYICGSRVLVKPYKEKGKINDRRFHDHQFKYMPPINHLPAVVYQREKPLLEHSEDEVHSLEKKLYALGLAGIQDYSLPVKIDSGICKANEKSDSAIDADTISDADDGFALQPNALKFVLDLLEGEDKDVDDPAAASTTAEPRSNPHALGDKFPTLDVPETCAAKMTGQNWQAQNAILGQNTWSVCSLFARSVF